MDINKSATYKIKKFQWNDIYDPIGSKIIELDGNEINISKGLEFDLVTTSVGPNALSCEFITDNLNIEVICSSDFLSPYFLTLIFSVYLSLDDWMIYSDAISSNNNNIEIQVDNSYYQETTTINQSGIIENKFIKFNSQNGFLFEYYYQFYDGPNHKNYKEVQIIRQDQDSWKTDSPQINYTSPGLDLFIVSFSISVIIIKKKFD